MMTTAVAVDIGRGYVGICSTSERHERVNICCVGVRDCTTLISPVARVSRLGERSYFRCIFFGMMVVFGRFWLISRS